MNECVLGTTVRRRAAPQLRLRASIGIRRRRGGRGAERSASRLRLLLGEGSGVSGGRFFIGYQKWGPSTVGPRFDPPQCGPEEALAARIRATFRFSGADSCRRADSRAQRVLCLCLVCLLQIIEDTGCQMLTTVIHVWTRCMSVELNIANKALKSPYRMHSL